MKLLLLLASIACASGMRINPDPIQSINQSMTDVGGDWLWSSDPVYDNTYSQVLTQPISMDVVTLSDIRWFTPHPTLTIRQSTDSNSRVDWSGIAYLLPDPSGGGGSSGVSSFAGRTGPVVPQVSDYAGFYLGSIHDSMTVERARVPDSARVSGLSDSAKALVRYARTTALHDTADTLRAYARARIHDSLAALTPARIGAQPALSGGSVGALPKWATSSTLGNSSMADDGTKISTIEPVGASSGVYSTTATGVWVGDNQYGMGAVGGILYLHSVLGVTSDRSVNIASNVSNDGFHIFQSSGSIADLIVVSAGAGGYFSNAVNGDFVARAPYGNHLLLGASNSAGNGSSTLSLGLNTAAVTGTLSVSGSGTAISAPNGGAVVQGLKTTTDTITGLTTAGLVTNTAAGVIGTSTAAGLGLVTGGPYLPTAGGSITSATGIKIPFNNSNANTLGIGTSANFGSNNFEFGISQASGVTHWPFGIVNNGTPVFSIQPSGVVTTAATGTAISAPNGGAVVQGLKTTTDTITGLTTAGLVTNTAAGVIGTSTAAGLGLVTGGPYLPVANPAFAGTLSGPTITAAGQITSTYSGSTTGPFGLVSKTTAPGISLWHTGAAANSKIWGIWGDIGGGLNFDAINDAQNSTISSTYLARNGDLTLQGALEAAGTITSNATGTAISAPNGDISTGGEVILASSQSLSGVGTYTQAFQTTNAIQYYDGGGAFTLTAPSASGFAGKSFRICNRAAIIPGFPTGANAYYTSPGAMVSVGHCVDAMSDGAKWFLLP